MSRKKPTIEDFINRPKTDKEWDEFERVPEQIDIEKDRLLTLLKESQLTKSERMMKKWKKNKFLTILLILLDSLKPIGSVDDISSLHPIKVVIKTIIFIGISYGGFGFWFLTIGEYFPNIGDTKTFFLSFPLFLGTLFIFYLLIDGIYDWIEDSF